MSGLEHLFSPLALGPVELPNRIVSTAHQTTLVHDHLPTDDFVAYHEARARGGAGLIVLEATAVHPSGLLTPHTLAGYLPEIVAGYRRVADAVQPHGTRLFVQLLPRRPRADRRPPRARPRSHRRRFRASASASSPARSAAREIDEIVDGYARAAELAAEGGLDGVEISAAHRYLVAQFFDPALNRRDDDWGEPSRFLARRLRAVRQAAPGLCVGRPPVRRLGARRGVGGLLRGRGSTTSALALGESSDVSRLVGIVPPPPVAESAIARARRAVRRRPPADRDVARRRSGRGGRAASPTGAPTPSA